MAHDPPPNVLILVTHGVERVELTAVRDDLVDRGMTVQVASLDGRPIQTFDELSPSDEVSADLSLQDVEATGFDALYLPGGIINPDLFLSRRGCARRDQVVPRSRQDHRVALP